MAKTSPIYFDEPESKWNRTAAEQSHFEIYESVIGDIFVFVFGKSGEVIYHKHYENKYDSTEISYGLLSHFVKHWREYRCGKDESTIEGHWQYDSLRLYIPIGMTWIIASNRDSSKYLFKRNFGKRAYRAFGIPRKKRRWKGRSRKFYSRGRKPIIR